MYVDDALAAHPLSSVVMARSWAGAPPMYICTGWEILAPEDKYLARRLSLQDGVKIVFEEYEAMPHCFALVLAQTPGAERCYAGWAGFIRDAVDNPEGIESAARMVRARTLQDVELGFEGLSDVGEEEMRRRVLEKAAFVGDTTAARL